MYNVNTCRFKRCLTVPQARIASDMTSCEYYLCVYIGDNTVQCIHRVEIQGATTQWPVNDGPSGLSVNKAHNVLVTCRAARKIKEFSSYGDKLREVTLPDDVVNPWHTLQLTSGKFIVCHGTSGDSVHRVCLMREDNGEIVHSYGGQRGSDVLSYLAMDYYEFVFVADDVNRRVTLLSLTLGYVRQVVSCDKLKW